MDNLICPYIGPRPFDRNDATFFFGREKEANDLLSIIIANSALLLYAPSGAGKTSLLNAEVIPMLKAEGCFLPFPTARIRGTVPIRIRRDETAKTNVFIFNTLMSWRKNETTKTLSHTSLTQFLENTQELSDDEYPFLRIIIFDQFEEIFTAHTEFWKHRKEFFKQIGEVLKNDRLLRVVFSMREDYIAELDPYLYLLPDKLRIRYRLEPLRRKQALAATTGPLKDTSLHFAVGVAEKLVEELLKVKIESGNEKTITILGEFVEPVQLQVVCKNLWEGLPKGTKKITKIHLDQYATIDLALGKFYENIITEIALTRKVDQDTIREWCDKWLITSTGTRSFVHRGRKETQGLSNEILDDLVAYHLLRIEWRAGARWYELIHDRFVESIHSSNTTWREKYTKLIKEFDSKMIKGEHKSVIKESDQLLNEALKNGNALIAVISLVFQSESYIVLKEIDQAIISYEKAHEVEVMYNFSDDNSYVSHRLLKTGNDLLYIGNYQDAVKIFTKLIKFFSNSVDGYYSLAAAYWYQGEYSEAIKTYNKQFKIEPNLLRVYNGRGQVYAEMGEYYKAIEDLTKSIKKSINENEDFFAYSSSGRGLAYAGIERYEQAFKDFDNSIEIQPKNAWVYFNRAQAYEWSNQPDRAVEDYKTALEMYNPPLPPFKREKAIIRLTELNSIRNYGNTSNGV